MTGNTTSANYPASGGVYCYSNHTPNHAVDATLASCTLSGNGISNFHFTATDFAAVILANCILQDSPLDPSSEIIDDGYNLSTDNGSGWLYLSTDQLNTDPGLDPLGLQDNGGPTQTIALTYGSPAIDKGNSASTTDQRGFPRPYDNPSIPNASGGNGSDIGAYEVQQSEDPVQGSTQFVVTTTDDHDDNVCGGADCTLREAVARANKFFVPCTIVFARNLHNPIYLNLGELVVTNSLTISNLNGIGPIDGSNASRVFNFTSGSSTLNYLTIQNGFNQINNFLGQTNTGGGISNSAILSIYSCSFFNNRVVGGSNSGAASGGKGEGGAIYNSGTLFLDSSTFGQTNGATGGNGGNGNARTGGGSGGPGQGGAVFNDTAGSLTVTNCTFSLNGAAGGNGGSGGAFGGNGGNGDGAAIYNLGTMSLTSATISGNAGYAGLGGSGGSNGKGGGSVTASSGTSTVRNTIVAGNTGSGEGPDANGAFSSQGYNLIGIGDFSSGFTGTADQVGTSAAPINPHLGQLQYNGGSTNTMTPQAGSTAIDQGKSFGLTSDQRGRARTLDLSTANATGGDGTDIGAYELGGGLGPFSAVSQKTHGPNVDPTKTFGIPLPLTGPIGVECRRNTGSDAPGTPNYGRDHEVVITFATNVTGLGSVVVKDSNNNTISSTLSLSDYILTIDLHSVPNARRLTIGLSGVSDGTDTVNINVPMGVLSGDTTGDGTVNSADVSQTKSRSGQTVGSTNFRNDVTVDGTLNSSDVSSVKSKSGTALP